MRTVDTHLHVWDLARVHYHWLAPDDPLLYRSYLPDEVYPQMQATGLDAALLVEAANHTAEIPFLLELAAQYDWIAGVIGWMSDDDQAVLPHPKLRGARIPAFVAGQPARLPRAVVELGLVCDLLMTPESYPEALALIQAYPHVNFVIEHFGGAGLTPEHHTVWASSMTPLAQQPNVALKVAGYMTSANPQPLRVDTLRAYLDESIRLFGAERLMFGSDYPICTRQGSYLDTVSMFREASSHLGVEAQALMLGGTAKRVYGISA